jgi:hypothetical protein
MASDVQNQESFVHRGYVVTIASWSVAERFVLRAEILRRDQVVCVLSRSGSPDRAQRLLQNIKTTALRWIDRR